MTCINITLDCPKCNSWNHTYLSHNEVEQEKLIPNTQRCSFCGYDIEIIKKNIVSVDTDLDYHIWILEDLKKVNANKFVKYRNYLLQKGLIVNPEKIGFDGKTKMTKYEVKEVLIIPQGEHTGKIDRNEVRETNHNGRKIVYQDYFIVMDDIKDKEGKPVEIKTGFPANITTESGHGKFLKAIGVKLSIGKSVDTDEANGKKIKFLTMNKQTDKGTFAEIVKESITLL